MKPLAEILSGVDGWLEPGQPEQLQAYAAMVPAGGRILEVGSYHGLSTLCLLAGAARTDGQPAATVLCCDTFNGSAEHAQIKADHFVTWRDNVLARGFPLPGVLVGRSQDFLPLLPAGSLDLVFIDGCHAWEVVSVDFREALRLTRPGGRIALHDVCRGWPDPLRVWEERASKVLRDHHGVGSLWSGIVQ